MNHSKNPLNLCDAIQRFADDGSTKERVLENGSTETMHSSGNILVDVLAVVIRISHPAQEDRTELWMADPSIETRKKNSREIRAMVTLFGRENVKLKVGDVIRFNGLSLRRTIRKGGSNKNSHTQNNTQRTATTYEFVQSWNTTHPGAAVEHTLFVLGHASAKDSRLMKRIPETMETHANLVQNLMDWYPTSSCAAQSKERLSTPPCQRRTLEEVTASLGVIGHVEVNILSLEASIAEKKSPAKKRKRASNAPKTYHMVTVSDTIGGNPVLFVHSIHSLVAVLQKALADNHLVILHNVVCRKGRDIPSWFTHQHYRNDETVLLATPTTYAVPVPATSELLTSKVQTHAMGQSQTQPFLSATQHSQHPTGTEEPVASLVLEAPLYAMEFDATKLRKDHSVWTSREKVMILLLERGEDGAVSYRNAILYLNHESVRNAKVHANTSALQELCCGLEASELQQHPKYQNHVIAFLRGLLEDKVVLRWKLCRDSGQDGAYNVETVTLIEL